MQTHLVHITLDVCIYLFICLLRMCVTGWGHILLQGWISPAHGCSRCPVPLPSLQSSKELICVQDSQEDPCGECKHPVPCLAQQPLLHPSCPHAAGKGAAAEALIFWGLPVSALEMQSCRNGCAGAGWRCNQASIPPPVLDTSRSPGQPSALAPNRFYKGYKETPLLWVPYQRNNPVSIHSKSPGQHKKCLFFPWHEHTKCGFDLLWKLLKWFPFGSTQTEKQNRKKKYQGIMCHHQDLSGVAWCSWTLSRLCKPLDYLLAVLNDFTIVLYKLMQITWLWRQIHWKYFLEVSSCMLPFMPVNLWNLNYLRRHMRRIWQLKKRCPLWLISLF